MKALSPPQLERLKYSELQRLAKGAGLKANLKADKLLKALKEHFHEIIQENENMVNKRGSSSTDTEELDDNEIPIHMTSVIQRSRKRKGDDQRNSEGKTVHEENPDFCSEKEILSELKESEEPQDAGCESTSKMKQTEHLASNGMTKNIVTPSQCKERISIKHGSIESKTHMGPVHGKKPQNTARLSKSGRTRVASTTPNFKKMHEAQFKKMQSIDDYIERKTKLAKNACNLVNEVKVLAKKRNYLKASPKETPNSNSKACSNSGEFLFSPHPQRKNLAATHTPASLHRSLRNSASKANILTLKSAFISTSVSSTKMNVRFSEATKDNEHKRSLIKTPSRKSPFLNACTPDNWKSSASVSAKDFSGSATKCHLTESSNSAVILKLGVPTEEPTSTKKPAFDLKASLSRPLRYQPHRGKLKPWGISKENIQRDYKQPVATTREERRETHEKERKQRKDQALGIRRGLTLA